MTTIDYYLSPLSPWTHLGHARLLAIAARHGATIDVRPVDFGRVFAASGGLPLKQRSLQRQEYRMTELRRWRDFLAIPMNLEPRFYPVSADLASKAIIAAATGGTDRQLQLAGALMKACWEEERDVSDTATVAAIAGACGFDGDALLVTAQSTGTGKTYDALTQEAIDRNVFGAPTYVIDGELFWGQDRLDFVDRALQR